LSIVEQSDIEFLDAKDMEFSDAANMIYLFESKHSEALDVENFEAEYNDPCVSYVFGFLEMQVVGYIKLYYDMRLEGAWLQTLCGNTAAMPDPMTPMVEFAISLARVSGAKWLYTTRVEESLDSSLYKHGFRVDSGGDLRYRLR
jgi:hypothetical protein